MRAVLSLTLKASPFQNEREADEAKHRPIVPPNMTTPIEVQSLAYYTTWVANAMKWAAEASGGRVSVGAIMLDQEAFSDGASLDPSIRRGVTEKNNAYHKASKAGAPGADVIQYNRGAWNLCPPAAPTCPIEFRNGTHAECTDPKENTDGIWCTEDGYYRSWQYTLDPDELGDGASVSLYTVPELTNMIQLFNRTAQTAKEHGLEWVSPFICLGCGYMRDVMSERRLVPLSVRLGLRRLLLVPPRCPRQRASALGGATAAGALRRLVDGEVRCVFPQYRRHAAGAMRRGEQRVAVQTVRQDGGAGAAAAALRELRAWRVSHDRQPVARAAGV